MKRSNGKSVYSVTTIVVGVLTCVLVFTACKKSNNDIPNTPVSALMAFNLAPDKSAIGINLSGSGLTPAPISYTGFTGNYLQVYTGSYNIQAFDSSSTAFTNSDYRLDTSKYYSLFVVGNGGTYKNLVVNDNFDSLVGTSGKAYLRYINAIPDSSKPNITISAGGSNVVSANTGFATISDFVSVTAGNVNVGLSNEGSINTSRTIALEEKKVYTILLLGTPAATDTAHKVQIRFITNGGLQ